MVSEHRDSFDYTFHDRFFKPGTFDGIPPEVVPVDVVLVSATAATDDPCSDVVHCAQRTWVLVDGKRLPVAEVGGYVSLNFTAGTAEATIVHIPVLVRSVQTVTVAFPEDSK